MYSPYLYARKFELLALRALLNENTDLTKLVPVVEPVNIDTDDLRRCLVAFTKKNQKIIIVINPELHEFSKNSTRQQKFRDDIKDLFQNNGNLIPGLLITSNTSQKALDNFLLSYQSRPTAFLHHGSAFTGKELTPYTKHQTPKHYIQHHHK